MEHDKVEFLHSFYLTPKLFLSQAIMQCGSKLWTQKAPDYRHLVSAHATPWGTSQHFGIFAALCSMGSFWTFPLVLWPSASQEEELGVASGAGCATIPKLSYLCQLGEQGPPKLKTWQMLLVVDATKTRPRFVEPGKSLHGNAHLGYTRIKCFQPQTACWCTCPMLLSAKVSL